VQFNTLHTFNDSIHTAAGPCTRPIFDGTLVFMYTQTGKQICFVKNQPIILYASQEFRICLKFLEISIKLIRVYS
jgi:hypothetical protein